MLTPFTQHRIVKWVNRIDSQRGGVSSPDRQQRMAALTGLAFDERLSYNSSCRPTVCMPIIMAWSGYCLYRDTLIHWPVSCQTECRSALQGKFPSALLFIYSIGARTTGEYDGFKPTCFWLQVLLAYIISFLCRLPLAVNSAKVGLVSRENYSSIYYWGTVGVA